MAVDITPSALLEFAKTIKSGDQKSASSSVATVTRIDPDGVTYVSLPGGVDETPIATAGTMYNVGDTVYVTLSGGKLRAEENLTSPSVGARIVKAATAPIDRMAKTAKQSADEAEKVANAVNQHFWYDDNGAHVTDVTKDEWAAAVADNFSDLSADKQYPNLLENSLGILLRSALNYLVSITRQSIAFYDGLGNTASNIVALFGTDGARIGAEDGSRFEIESDSLSAYDSNGDLYFSVSDSGLIYGNKLAASSEALDNLSSEFIGVQGDVEAISEFITINGSTMTLGKHGHPVCAVLSESGLVFYPVNENDEIDVENPIASLVVEGADSSAMGVLVIHRAVIVNEMRVGKWKWMPRANNNLALKWMG